MKEKVFIREIDLLGRVVLPIEYRRHLSIEAKDDIEIFVENEEIIMKKYQPSCVLCGQVKNTIQFRGKEICRECINDI